VVYEAESGTRREQEWLKQAERDPDDAQYAFAGGERL